MPSLNPSPEQLADYVAAMPSGVPILMLNLLRYNAQATSARQPAQPCSGREAYACYSRVALTKVQAGGAWSCAPSPCDADSAAGGRMG